MSHPARTSRLDPLLTWGLLLLLVWAPLPRASNQMWSNGLLILLTGMLLLLFCIGQWLGKLPAPRLPGASKPMLILLLLTQGWVAIQWLAGWRVSPDDTLNYLMLGLSYSALFLLLIQQFNSRKRLILLVATLVASGTFQAFYGAFMTLSGNEWLLFEPKTSYIGDATGTFVNRNSMAGYLEMTAGLAIGLLMAWRSTGQFEWTDLLEALTGARARVRIAAIIMAIALVMTHSRAGNVAFFAALVLCGLLFIIRDREHRLRNSLILGGFLLVDVLMVSQFFGLHQLRDRLMNTQLQPVIVDGEVVNQGETRMRVWQDAWPMFTDQPLQGIGAGGFNIGFERYQGPSIHLHYVHAHNDWLQFLIEYGLPGFLLLLAFCLLAAWQAVRALWSNGSPFRSGMGLGCTIGLLAIAMHAMLDFNLQIPANAVTFIALAAIAVLNQTHSARRRHPPAATEHRESPAPAQQTWLSASDQPHMTGTERRLGPRGDIELAVDFLDVTRDGVARQPEQAGRLSHGHALGDDTEDFLFTRGEHVTGLRPGGVEVTEDLAGNRG